MTFQAYIDTIHEKTGKTPDDFRALAAAKGLAGPGVKAGDVLAWLAEDFGLGRGHGMAIYSILKDDAAPRGGAEDRIEKQFTGARAAWRPSFETIVARAKALGGDVTLAPTDSYVSLVRAGRKFAIVAVTAKRLDLGVKLKNDDPGSRFEPAGSWNSMVTHRARVDDPAQLDDELLRWVDAAYREA